MRPAESAVPRRLSYLGPVRYYMELALGILMKGVGLETLWPQLLALAEAAGLLGAWSVGATEALSLRLTAAPIKHG